MTQLAAVWSDKSNAAAPPKPWPEHTIRETAEPPSSPPAARMTAGIKSPFAPSQALEATAITQQ